ncbi:MAG: acetyl-CoA carboxylase biotin carboxylase subunit [Gemmatimonadota bacterium]
MLRKVLIANRGEIAVRVIRACQDLGISSVAVFSDADRDALHVRLADQAVSVGPPPASDSYLVGARLIQAATDSGCDAVHPGYGFLAENAKFARGVTEAGLVFVGPPAAAIEAMGDKTEARSRLAGTGVPLIPGTSRLDSPAAASVEAAKLGFPVLLKAAAGGGGRGMRAVSDPADIESAFSAAQNEARQAFGDETVYAEKFLEAPRHIEIQVFGDEYGAVVALGERECSIQRRHQKLIEESPSTALSDELRARMQEAAVLVAQSVDYVGAGTVEFLLQDEEFYFLEMNTRIQVEHPVTELVMGVDLVREQLRIAAGEPLGSDLVNCQATGHAIECRISGEDPYGGFLPSTGRVEALRVPGGPGVRWEAGIAAGSDVGLDYDSLLGKLIVHASSRSEAIARMRRALDELVIRGVTTTQPFHASVMRETDFVAGNTTIRYLERHPDLTRPEADEAGREVAALVAVLAETALGPAAPRAADPSAESSRAGIRSSWRERFAPR